MNDLNPLSGRQIRIGAKAILGIAPVADCARFSLRGETTAIGEMLSAAGLQAPSEIGTSTASGETIVCKLAPDEWYLLVAANAVGSLLRESEAAYKSAPHSLVDVSHREVGIEVSGDQATWVLQATAPFDVEEMEVGCSRRTLIDKAQVILIRSSETNFRIEVWRSFATHVWGVLDATSRELPLIFEGTVKG